MNPNLFTSPSGFMDSDLDQSWNDDDTSKYLYDSPQPESSIPSYSTDLDSNVNPANNPSIDPSSQPQQDLFLDDPIHPSSNDTTSSHLNAPTDPNTTQSSGSNSSRGSSADSSTQKPKQLWTPSSSDNNITRLDQDTHMKDDFSPVTSHDYAANAVSRGSFSNADPRFQMNYGMDNLSLSTGNNVHFPSTTAQDFSPSNAIFTNFNDNGISSSPFSSLQNISTNHPNEMPLHTKRTKFALGDSREESPNDVHVKNNSNDSSPFPLTATSPMGVQFEPMTSLDSSPMDERMNLSAPFASSSRGYQGIQSRPNTQGPHLTAKQLKQQPPQKSWPCIMTVADLGDKSRVETQIDVKLTLHNIPRGIKRIHLPSHTISKPKFQQKPPWEKSPDTLELSCLLFSASAMQRSGVPERAFARAEVGDVPERKSDETPTPDDDPEKPLNGGPITICSNCINRERKRAARKKTKKPEEEQEWAKDEAKRVIVFNCAEVRDWCVPDSNETPVKDHDGPLSAAFVHMPMRIACYCRHHQEKIGFQVVFTLRTSNGEIVSQASSDSIMITDDHKQPMPPHLIGPGGHFAPGFPVQGMFAPGANFGMVPSAWTAKESPYRSWSTPDLQYLQRHYGVFGPEFAAQLSGQTSEATTASATPRNLSRPASPTNPSGQPGAKKRRSGGINHARVPSGLSMTSARPSPPSSSGHNNPATSMAPNALTTAFSFQSPASGNFGTTFDRSFQGNQQFNTLQSGPTTPLGGTTSAFSPTNHENDAYQFYSAPTSQHQSRAPSPNSAAHARLMQSQQPTSVPSTNSQVASQVAYALNALPRDVDVQKPPIIQRLSPATGSRHGDDDVTLFGSGFVDGLVIMFGDSPVTPIERWGDGAIRCRSPPWNPQLMKTNPVSVVFQHQHHSADATTQKINSIMPTQVMKFHYRDDHQAQSQAQVQSQSQAHSQAQQHANLQALKFAQHHQNQRSMAGVHAAAAARFPGGTTHGFPGNLVSNRSSNSLPTTPDSSSPVQTLDQPHAHPRHNQQAHANTLEEQAAKMTAQNVGPGSGGNMAGVNHFSQNAAMGSGSGMGSSPTSMTGNAGNLMGMAGRAGVTGMAGMAGMAGSQPAQQYISPQNLNLAVARGQMQHAGGVSQGHNARMPHKQLSGDMVAELRRNQMG